MFIISPSQRVVGLYVLILLGEMDQIYVQVFPCSLAYFITIIDPLCETLSACWPAPVMHKSNKSAQSLSLFFSIYRAHAKHHIKVYLLYTNNNIVLYIAAAAAVLIYN